MYSNEGDGLNKYKAKPRDKFINGDNFGLKPGDTGDDGNDRRKHRRSQSASRRRQYGDAYSYHGKSEYERTVAAWEEKEQRMNDALYEEIKKVKVGKPMHRVCLSIVKRPSYKIIKEQQNVSSATGKAHKVLPPEFEPVDWMEKVATRSGYSKPYLRMRAVSLDPSKTRHGPAMCPDCKQPKCLSDMAHHFVFDHYHVPRMRMNPGSHRSFAIEPRLSNFSKARTRMIFLLRNKIVGISNGQLRDVLPVVVMDSKVRLSELNGLRSLPVEPVFWMFWIASLYPDHLKLCASLTLAKRTRNEGAKGITFTGEILNMRDVQSLSQVYNSGQFMLITEKEIQSFTNNGKNLLNFQIVVY